ncbi:arrestin domain-containing protein 1-like [Diadema antillarum]|uniref:arrestin domain-containing protein 1-like n=1 Tax=Diadema antillarum TaxID=105358 RepID=UPI003A879451
MSSKLQVFDIVFEGNDANVFKPGDLIQGYVLIVLSSEKRHIRGIRVRFKGRTKTEWRKNESKDDYSWKEVLFDYTLLVFGEDPVSDRSYILPAGRHKFPFRYRLPLGLPPEMYCKFAKVTYVVKAIIDRPMKYDHSSKRSFRIRPVVDLNLVSDVLHPIGDQMTAKEGCLCCETGPVTLEISVDKRGYIVGESMWISGRVDNQSNNDISLITCTLIQTITFFAKSGWSTDDRRIRDYVAEIELEGCASYQKKVIEPTPFMVPPIVPCAFESCPNIFLEYSLKIAAVVGFETPVCVLKLPISIGTIAVLHSNPPPAVNMAVTHQSEVKRMEPPPPSYDIAISSFREMESGQEPPVPPRLSLPRLPSLPIVTNYTPGHSISLPVSASPQTPSSRTKFDVTPAFEQQLNRERYILPPSPYATISSGSLPAVSASISPLSPTSRLRYETTPSSTRVSDRSLPVVANSMATNYSPTSHSPMSPLNAKPKQNTAVQPELNSERTSLLANRMTSGDSSTYYDTSLGYEQPAIDPWRSSNKLIREIPQEQRISRTSGRIAEAFV